MSEQQEKLDKGVDRLMDYFSNQYDTRSSYSALLDKLTDNPDQTIREFFESWADDDGLDDDFDDDVDYGEMREVEEDA
tara:strand:+ start:4657 stop:4890 length:234 start_codon:yes stop_codon:yes gene_type:complete